MRQDRTSTGESDVTAPLSITGTARSTGGTGPPVVDPDSQQRRDPTLRPCDPVYATGMSGRSEPTPRPKLHQHLSARRDRALCATLGFVVGVLVTRGITTVLHYHGAGPNGGIVIDGVHVHHMVFGIILLLADSYAWLLLTAIDHEHHRRRSRLSAAVYGVAGALILDEFALWLNLRDVYWQRQGRESVDALAAFAALLTAASIAGPFLSALAKHYRASRPPAPS